MEWLDKTWFVALDMSFNAWSFFKLMAYFSAGFVVDKIYYYVALRKYRRSIESATKTFLKSKNLAVQVIPDSLQSEWVTYWDSKRIVKPTPETFLNMLGWPITIILIIIYFVLVLPIMKLFGTLGGINRWIESRALSGFDEPSPINKEEVVNKKPGDETALDDFRKTIGPKK